MNAQAIKQSIKDNYKIVNPKYLKQTAKSNYKSLIIFTLVLCTFLAVIIGVSASMADRARMPGMTLEWLLSAQYFGMMAIMFPMIYIIMLGNKLIAGKVDKGDMAYVLATPTTRLQVVMTSLIYFVMSLVIMFLCILLTGIISAAAFSADLDLGNFAMMTFGAFLLQFCLGGICFAASCFFNRSNSSLAVGGGLPVAFFMLKILSAVADELEFLEFFTLLTLYSPDAVAAGTGYVGQFIGMAVIGIALYIFGVVSFKKKDLPL